MRVQAAPGLKVPREGQPRRYITDAEPVELESVTGYYIRRLAAGELVEVPAQTQAESAVETTKKTKA